MVNEQMSRRYRAAVIVASNWRIQQRLPRITALAIALGLNMSTK